MKLTRRLCALLLAALLMLAAAGCSSEPSSTASDSPSGKQLFPAGRIPVRTGGEFLQSRGTAL